jgi:hypothetical protein
MKQAAKALFFRRVCSSNERLLTHETIPELLNTFS